MTVLRCEIENQIGATAVHTAGNGAFKTKKSNIKTVFPQKAKDGISLSHKDINIKLTPKFTTSLTNPLLSAVSESAKAKKVTVEPISSEVKVTKLDKKTLSYYYNDSTRLEYSLTYTGFKEDIVVSEYTGQTEYVFTLETNGLTLRESEGAYYLTDENGETRANLGDIVILTADGNNDTTGYMTHKEIKKNKEYELTIHVDGEWLADEKTAYPIRIDPTVDIRDGEDEVEDITINSNAAAEAGSQSLYVGYREGYGVSRVLMKFPGLVLADVLTSKNIRSAEVCMYDTMQNNASMKVIAYLFTGNEWVESTANWTNVNAESYTHFLSQDTVSYGRGNAYNPKHWYAFNIVDYIKLCMNEPEHIDKGIMFKAADSVEDAGVNNYKSFGSFDGTTSQRPHITVTYDNDNNTNTKPFGWFDSVTDTYAKGWAWCVDAPNDAVTVKIHLKNETTGQQFEPIECVADIYRADVKNAGYGTGRYGFSCPINWDRYTPGDYTVRAIAISPGGTADDENDCYELQSPKTYTKLGYAEVFPEGAFYFNNREFGRYLKNTSGTADAQSGLLANLGLDIQWVLTKFSDGYAIQNSGDTTKMLAVPTDYTSDSVILSEPDVLGPYNYVWDIIVAGSGCFLKSRHNNRYLYIDANGNLKTRVEGGQYYYDETTGTYVDTTAEASWRIVDTQEYGVGLTYREESGNTSFKNIIIKQGQTHAIEISTKIPSNAIWCEPSDFEYSTEYAGVTINDTTNTVTGESACSAYVRAVHKVTGRTSYHFTCYVCEYVVEAHCKYDTGFILKFGNGNESSGVIKINEEMKYIKEFYAEKFSVYIDYDIEHYQSLLDESKDDGNVTLENIDATYDPENPNNDLLDSNIRADFTSDFNVLNSNEVNILWTGHNSYTYVDDGIEETITDDDDDQTVLEKLDLYSNRCYYFEQRIYMTQTVNKQTLAHEFAHFLGAPDHYHEGDDNTTCSNERCTVCNTSQDNPYKEYCLMGEEQGEGDMFCDQCSIDIIDKCNNSFKLLN